MEKPVMSLEQREAALAKAKAEGAKKIYINERRACEHVIPAYMLHLSIEAMAAQKVGEIRADFEEHLNRAQQASLVRLDEFTANRVARRVDRDVRRSLTSLQVQRDARTLVVAVSLCILKLVDEGLYEDKDNVAVLMALAIVEEARHDGEHWAYYPSMGVTEATQLFKLLRLSGYYV